MTKPATTEIKPSPKVKTCMFCGKPQKHLKSNGEWATYEICPCLFKLKPEARSEG